MSALSRRAILGAAVLLGGCKAPPAASSAITVTAATGSSSGKLTVQGRVFDCMLGRSGILRHKRESDGGTPAGLFPLREIRYRADRLAAEPVSQLPRVPTKPSDGWCDEPRDPAYNRLVTRPYPASSEALWRADEAYDVLAVIGYNDAPPLAGAGSAIFLHVMRRDSGRPLATAGCVSLARQDLLTVLALCGPRTFIHIAAV